MMEYLVFCFEFLTVVIEQEILGQSQLFFFGIQDLLSDPMKN